MKIRMSQISRAVSALIERLKKLDALQDEKVVSLELEINEKKIKVPDKQWFCSDMKLFSKLDGVIEEVVKHDAEKKKEAKNENTGEMGCDKH